MKNKNTFYYIALILIVLICGGCGRYNSESKVLISFDSNGGSAIESVEINKGEQIPIPCVPNCEGYTFDGWTYDNSNWDFKTDIATISLTLIASWKPNKYCITYDAEGADCIKKQDVLYNETVILAKPQRSGYSFDGWYYNNEKIEDGIWNIASDVTLVAKWSQKYITVTFKTNDGLEIDSFTVEQGTKIQPIYPYKEGYYCVWYNENTIWNFDHAIYDDTTLTAHWLNEDFIYDNVVYGINQKSTLEVKSITSSSNQFVFPQEIIIESNIYGLNVTNICDNAFSGDNYYYAQHLKSIIIPSTIASIGSRAFAGLQLESITIPDSVEYIGEGIFANCKQLTSIILSKNLNYISDNMFSCCDMLTNITMYDGITSIGGNAFGYCISLTSITIPDTVLEIKDAAFYGCEKLEKIILGNQIKYIGKRAFCRCTELNDIALPYGIETLYSLTFSNCIKLKQIIIPKSVTKIESGAIDSCTNLESVIIPSSVIIIDEYAINGCDKAIIYCEVSYPPDGWNRYITNDIFKIVWDYSYED